MRLSTYHILLRSVKNKQKHKRVTYSTADSLHLFKDPTWMDRRLLAHMYGWCNCLIHGVDSTKATQFSAISQTPPPPLPPSPPSHFSSHLHQPPFSPAIQLLLSPGQQAIQIAVAEQRQAVSCQLSERERERGRERPSSLSTKRYYCLATNHGHPHPPTSSLSLQEKQAGCEKYTVRGQLWLIIMGCLRLWWLWSFGGKAYTMPKLTWIHSQGSRVCAHECVYEWPVLIVLSIHLYYHLDTMDNHSILSSAWTNQYASLRMLAPNEMLEWELHAFSKGSLTMLSL